MRSKNIITIIISVVIVALIFDISYARTFELIFHSNNLNLNVLLFVIVSSVCIIGQYYILEFIKMKKVMWGDNTNNILKVNLRQIVTVIQYFLAAIILVVIFQITILSQYTVSLLIISSTISYILSIILISLLTSKFFFWFKSDKNFVVFLYGFASAILVINLCITFIFTESILFGKPPQLGPHFGTGGFTPESGSNLSIIEDLYIITSIGSFLILWFATVMFLFPHKHHNDEGKKRSISKYLVISFIPLMYFLSQFILLFLNIFSPLINEIPIQLGIILTLVFLLSKPIGGILFGAVFFLLRRDLPDKSPAKDYLIISSFGMVILFVVNQGVTLSNALYPPFGLVTVSLLGLASYMFLVGLYSSAISSAQDRNLRRIMKNSVMDQSKLLTSLGYAEMERQIENKVSKIAKNKKIMLESKTDISLSFGDEEIKRYLDFLINEMSNQRNSEASVESERNIRLECLKCKIIFPTKEDLIQHLKSNHIGNDHMDTS
ncbi:MAG: hypothetical protein H0X03_06555 [Nitrosopumilus sp.]|nr:hypothetical protein [Nitrosopumilus sp.]